MRDRVAVAALGAFFAAAAVVACAGRGGSRVALREPHACPRDAVAVGGVCRCAPGLSVLEGACVGQREQSAYCGAPPLAACVMAPCPSGDPIDLATRACAPARAAREVVARVHPIPDDFALGCHDGRVLVLHDDYVACLPMADVCPRGTVWDPGTTRCLAAEPCAPGEVRSERSGGEDGGDSTECVPVVAGAGARATSGTRARWSTSGGGRARCSGADGGEGTARLCRPLALQPWELDVGPGGARTLTLTIELLFPDNDVTQVAGRTRGDGRGFTAARLRSGGAGCAEGARRAPDAPARARGGIGRSERDPARAVHRPRRRDAVPRSPEGRRS